MNLLLLAVLSLATPTDPSAQTARAVESWTCTVNEQLDQNVSGMLQMLVYPDGTARELSYYVNWASRPGYMAEQQMNWIWIPIDATRLWKPDAINFSVKTKRADKQSSITFVSPRLGRTSWSARPIVRSLRPTFSLDWVTIEDAHLIAQLWDDWPFEAELSDRRGHVLGRQSILLPGAAATQAMFTRLRARLSENAEAPASQCTANLEPDEWDRMQEVI